MFASANMAHPKALADAGKAGPVRAFARNTLCALAGAGVKTTPGNAARHDPRPEGEARHLHAEGRPLRRLRLAALRQRREARSPGAQKALEAKALQLTGGPQHPPPPKDRNGLRRDRRQGRGRRVPHLLHQRDPRAEGGAARCRSSAIARQPQRGGRLRPGRDERARSRPAARFADFLLVGRGARPSSAPTGSPRRNETAMIEVDLRAVWRVRSGGEERELDQMLITAARGASGSRASSRTRPARRASATATPGTSSIAGAPSSARRSW